MNTSAHNPAKRFDDKVIPSRREFLRAATIAACGAPLADRVFAQAAPKELPPLNRFARMVHEFYDRQIALAQDVGRQRKQALKTPADAQAYVQFVQQKIRESFGPFPEKTPLKPRVSGIIDRDAYTIEKVTFESRPEFFVTANLYVPKDRKFPLPGVVGSCGHSVNGKAAEAYQSFAQGLARQGYVVLIFDPIGQGERSQYPDDGLKSLVGPGVSEHLLCGNQQFLVGEFFGLWRAWDGIRALDYLLSRSEVDPQHVGITGNSGGGTMTMWLCGLEQRWTMAAPSCAVTTFRRNFRNELPADTEQCPPRCLAFGLDHDDFLAALAPKPIIIMAQEKDYFDARGSQESYEHLRRLYGLLGAEENIRLHIGPDPHGYTLANREAMYGFFNGVTKVANGHREPPLTIEKDETLWVTPRGQVVDLPSRTVMDFTREKAEALKQARGDVETDKLPAILREVLQLPEMPTDPPGDRVLRSIGGRQYPLPHFTTYAVETDPGIEALVYRLSNQPHTSRVPATGPQALLYVSHHSADVELRTDPWLRELCKSEASSTLFTVDVRGIGESRPDTCGANTFLSAYGSDYFYAAHGLMLDRPYPGQKTFDLLRVLQWLEAHGFTQIHLAASGWGTIPATFAAVFTESVTRVTLKHALTSFQALAETDRYTWPLSSFPPGLLQHADLTDCYRALKSRQLTLVEPVGPDGKPS